jgi:hypothetical protein
MQAWYGEDNEWYIDGDAEATFFYHVHEDHTKFPDSGYYLVTKEGKCRQCETMAPKGVRFMAATAKLGECR